MSFTRLSNAPGNKETTVDRDPDKLRRAYEEMKGRFRTTKIDDFKTGKWFAQFVHWMLKNYARTVDADYFKRKYPGACASDLVKQLVTLTSKHNAVAGGISAAGISALELASFGPQVIATVPAVGSFVIADIAFCTRAQLRAIYDLSVLHGAPLSVDDADDCYFIFLAALGIELGEIAGGIGKAVGPGVVAYNVRKLLRSGLRKALQQALKKVGGTQLARKLTERAMLRLLVPGINVPVASGFNYYFTRQLLKAADRQMARRGAVVRPLVRLHSREPNLAKTFGPKLLIAIADHGDPAGWSKLQMEALRHCQSALSLSDGDLEAFDSYFDRTVADLAKELPPGFAKGADDLLEIAHIQAAFARDASCDVAFADAIVTLGDNCGKQISAEETLKRIKSMRRQFR